MPTARSVESWSDHSVVVTPDAETRLRSENLSHYLGGWNEDGDTYETQEYQFEEELNAFWAELLGPDEWFRRSVVNAMSSLKRSWQSIAIDFDGKMRIQFADRTAKTITPPRSQIASSGTDA